MKDVFKIALWVLFIGIVIGAVSFVLNMGGDAAQTVQKEFSASAMLKKYEDFKDQAAVLDKKTADIDLLKEQIEETSPTDKEEYNLLRSEFRGLVASYNSLAAEYNANMAKFNYAFTNAGSLPASNLKPLPREYKPYINSTK